jgi:hypothetical protein
MRSQWPSTSVVYLWLMPWGIMEGMVLELLELAYRESLTQKSALHYEPG